MIKEKFLAVILASCMLAHGTTLDNAANTAKDANSGIMDIISATALACREDAQNAPYTLSVILSQRENWTDEELYQIFTVVLVSSDLAKSLTKDYRAFLEDNGDGGTGVNLLRVLKEHCSPQNERFFAIVETAIADANGRTPMRKRDPRPHPAPVTPEPISPQN